MADQEGEERIVPMRLQKFLARAGVASRRGSEDLMTAGRVRVNGQVVTELGSKVDPLVDEVTVDGMPVHLADKPFTIMLHKPMDYVTTMSDPQGRPCVAQLVPTAEHPGLFPVGRLDRDTTGLLLFSTDGELGHGLLRPRANVVKRYFALVEGVPTQEELERVREGVMLDDGLALPAEARLLDGREARQMLDVLELEPREARLGRGRQVAALASGERSVVEVGLHEGRKREVRRMMGALGHPVHALHRSSFGPIELGDLPRGQWRELTSAEVEALHRAAAQGEQDGQEGRGAQGARKDQPARVSQPVRAPQVAHASQAADPARPGSEHTDASAPSC